MFHESTDFETTGDHGARMRGEECEREGEKDKERFCSIKWKFFVYFKNIDGHLRHLHWDKSLLPLSPRNETSFSPGSRTKSSIFSTSQVRSFLSLFLSLSVSGIKSIPLTWCIQFNPRTVLESWMSVDWIVDSRKGTKRRRTKTVFEVCLFLFLSF